MPKSEFRRRVTSSSHAPAVKPKAERQPQPSSSLAQPSALPSSLDQFAGLLGQSAEDAIHTLSLPLAHQPPTLTKKEKQTMKRQALLAKLSDPPNVHNHPYNLSASSLRRAKKREKEKLAGGGLSALELALKGLEKEVEDELDEGYAEELGAAEAEGGEGQDKVPEGKIGSGKARGLSAKQRRAAVQTEAARLPQILSHPSFASNPFETIRLHAQNTLVQRGAPPKRSKKVKGDGMEM